MMNSTSDVVETAVDALKRRWGLEGRGMNAPFVEPAHSPFGGSVATRVLRCPASVGLVEKLPAHLRKSSAYADRGTALHAAMALLLDDSGPCIESLRDKTINDYTVTDDDIELALRPVLTYVVALLDTPGAEYYLEHRVVFPTIAKAYGTADLLVRIGTTVHVVDFKFGAGVRVLALYPDGAEDVINTQLAFYAAAARHSHPEFFAGVDNIILTILQPMSIEPGADMVSSVEVTHDELNEFTTVYRAACERALSPSPRFERGAWCRFCAARPICPAHTGPLLDLAQTAGVAAEGRAIGVGPDCARQNGILGSRRAGVSLVRSENARAPLPGRSEIVRSFSAALQTLRKGDTNAKRPRSRSRWRPRLRQR
jgi:hypothetical protein